MHKSINSEKISFQYLLQICETIVHRWDVKEIPPDVICKIFNMPPYSNKATISLMLALQFDFFL